MIQTLTELQEAIVAHLKTTESRQTSTKIGYAINRAATTVLASLIALEKLGYVERIRKGRADFWCLLAAADKLPQPQPMLPKPKLDPAPGDVERMPDRIALASRLLELEIERADILKKLGEV